MSKSTERAFHSFRRGWTDGAGMKSLDPDFREDFNYAAAWQAGREAWRDAIAKERVRLGLPVEKGIIPAEAEHE